MPRAQMTLRRAHPASASACVARELNVYDGQDRIGLILIEDDSFTAFDAAGKRLGVFGDQKSAALAIGAASGHRSHG
jgi:hypothetical protein